MKAKIIYYRLRALIALLITIPFLILYSIFYALFLYVFIIFVPLFLSLVCFSSVKEFKQDYKQIIKEGAMFSMNYKPSLNLNLWHAK
jgi:hypothetical protein